jgi:transcription initiation factor IIE alpha subunit
MNLCSDNHDEVCFEGGRWPECPACFEIAKRDDTIEQLREQIDELKDQLKDKTQEGERLEEKRKESA